METNTIHLVYNAFNLSNNTVQSNYKTFLMKTSIDETYILQYEFILLSWEMQLKFTYNAIV